MFKNHILRFYSRTYFFKWIGAIDFLNAFTLERRKVKFNGV